MSKLYPQCHTPCYLHFLELNFTFNCVHTSLFWAFNCIYTLDGEIECAESEHICDNEVCIPKSEVCDGKYDCDDKTDEMGCHDSLPASSHEHEGMYLLFWFFENSKLTHKHTFAHHTHVLCLAFYHFFLLKNVCFKINGAVTSKPLLVVLLITLYLFPFSK